MDVYGERGLLLSELRLGLRKEYQPNCTRTGRSAGKHSRRGTANKEYEDKKS